MPSQRQPKRLRLSCVIATSDMIINQLLSCPDLGREKSIQKLLYRYAPPIIIQDVLTCVMELLGTLYSPCASPEIISSLLRILLHPRLTEVHLSELTYIGNVEHDSLDMFEAELIKHLPEMSQLTHLDLSTHRYKTTFPSCSDEILQVLGSHCPNLKVLNLNFNNRVTGNGLSYLYPSKDYPGCGKLEKLFVQDCSILPEDVAVVLCSFQNLEIVGYKELGTSMRKLKSRSFFRKRKGCLKLTHLDNTLSGVQRDDGDIVKFLVDSCPFIENLKIRVCDENLNEIHKLQNLMHLEVRYFTGVHHPVGRCSELYLKTCGSRLTSFTMYCSVLHSQNILVIAESCVNLKKLFLHANIAVIDEPLDINRNKLEMIEMLHLRLGDDELVMNLAACAFVEFLVGKSWKLQELYLMVRSPEFHHNFINSLVQMNPLSHLRNLIIDVPRRTLAAPMLEFDKDTAFLLMDTCDKLKILGNLICWDITPEQVSELRVASKVRNYNLTIIYAQSNKLNTKYL
ncbi:uncharacterized protein [Palaemon carinicauda]|uniref:uncharacterized protein n=1 Tax=Palaemon carinicauda TaxID=392227 RepID=UPI0035B5B555